MNTRIFAAALVAPMIALGPATAWAHRCPGYHHHHHHAPGVDKEKYGSSREMQNRGGSSNQDLNQGTGQTPGAGQGPGSTDQGVGGSSSSGSKRQGI